LDTEVYDLRPADYTTTTTTTSVLGITYRYKRHGNIGLQRALRTNARYMLWQCRLSVIRMICAQTLEFE